MGVGGNPGRRPVKFWRFITTNSNFLNQNVQFIIHSAHHCSEKAPGAQYKILLSMYVFCVSLPTSNMGGFFKNIFACFADRMGGRI